MTSFIGVWRILLLQRRISFTLRGIRERKDCLQVRNMQFLKMFVPPKLTAKTENEINTFLLDQVETLVKRVENAKNPNKENIPNVKEVLHT